MIELFKLERTLRFTEESFYNDGLIQHPVKNISISRLIQHCMIDSALYGQGTICAD